MTMTMDDAAFDAMFDAMFDEKYAPIICAEKVGDFVGSDSCTFIPPDNHDLVAEVRRDGRKREADDFRRSYSCGSSFEDITFLVWPDNVESVVESLTAKSSGIIWVGVHGLDSICVVTRTGDLDVTRVHRDLKYLTKETVLRRFRRTVISEIEDLARLHVPKPFGVVSVVHDNFQKESVLEASSDVDEEDEEVESSQVSSDEVESNVKMVARLRKYLLKEEKRQENNGPKIAGYDETKTIKFLRDQMRVGTAVKETIQESSGIKAGDAERAVNFLKDKMESMKMETFTVDETIKTAISAFQHLFQKTFKADEIGVTVMDPDYFVTFEEAEYKDIYVKELEISDIERHLAASNEPGGECT